MALLAAADHLLVPSLWYENAPLAVIEAAAYGLGVLGSRIGGIPELVREGRTGLLFEPGDDAALAGAMRGLATGEIGLDGLAESSWELARSHTVERMVDDYIAHYEQVSPREHRRCGGGKYRRRAAAAERAAACWCPG